MVLTSSEFVLSTHEEGRPKKSIVLNTSFGYFGVSIIFFIFGIYGYLTYSKDSVISTAITFFFIVLGLITLVLGVVNISRVETIKVNDFGISITKGKKIREAPWSDVIEIKSWETTYPFGRTVQIVRQIIIKSVTWKYKVNEGNFKIDQLKELFLNIADHAKNHKTTVIDGLNWLPNEPKFQNEKEVAYSLRMKEYKILIKVGAGLLLIGLVCFVIVFLLNGWNSPWFAAGAILLLFGGMCFLGGWFGSNDERKKMELPPE